jgi:anti-sigma B factor antagonist
MSMQSLKRGSTTVVFLEGSIDGKTAPIVRDELRPILENANDVVLDMSKVDYLSSAGLRLMLLVYREFAAKNKKLVLAGLSQEIKEVMSYTGFLNFFDLAPSNVQKLKVSA